MSKINIGVTQEYTQIAVQGPTEIVMPDTTGSSKSFLSRKVIMLIENDPTVHNHPITWSMVTGLDQSSDPIIPAGSTSTASIVWENNDVPSVIGQVAGDQPEAILIELWEGEMTPGIWVWYGKYNRYGDVPVITPETEIEMVDIFLEAAGLENTYSLNAVYGSRFATGDLITLNNKFPSFVHAVEPPEQTVEFLLRIRKFGSVELELGVIRFSAGTRLGSLSLYNPTIVEPGDQIYMHSPTVLDSTLKDVTVLFQGQRTKNNSLVVSDTSSYSSSSAS